MANRGDQMSGSYVRLQVLCEQLLVRAAEAGNFPCLPKRGRCRPLYQLKSQCKGSLWNLLPNTKYAYLPTIV